MKGSVRKQKTVARRMVVNVYMENYMESIKLITTHKV